jgi:hypothetical protein
LLTVLFFAQFVLLPREATCASEHGQAAGAAGAMHHHGMPAPPQHHAPAGHEDAPPCCQAIASCSGCATTSARTLAWSLAPTHAGLREHADEDPPLIRFAPDPPPPRA